VKLLVDTQVFLWSVQDQAHLPGPILRALERPDAELFLSAASLWEARLKHEKGKLPLKDGVLALALDFLGARERLLAITADHAAHTLRDPSATLAPFDRLLLAQCELENMRLLTADRALKGHRLAAAI
jgi:PIN domain nuclease of toxin-antitoxin system